MYTSIRDMGRPRDYRPQPVEIDLSNSRTLPSPSASAAAWENPNFHDFGDLSAHGPSGIPRHGHMDFQSHSRGITQDTLGMWYAANDGPWVPKSISEVPIQNISSRSRVSNARIPLRYDGPFRQSNPLDAGQYHFGAEPQYRAPVSDSGYASNTAKRSDGNASIYSAEIHDQDDCQSLPGNVGTDYPAFQGMNEVLQQREINATDSWTLGSTRLETQPPLMCLECNKVVKTKSELK